jgi:hypothetical protein
MSPLESSYILGSRVGVEGFKERFWNQAVTSLERVSLGFSSYPSGEECASPKVILYGAVLALAVSEQNVSPLYFGG